MNFREIDELLKEAKNKRREVLATMVFIVVQDGVQAKSFSIEEISNKLMQLIDEYTDSIININ